MRQSKKRELKSRTEGNLYSTSSGSRGLRLRLRMLFILCWQPRFPTANQAQQLWNYSCSFSKLPPLKIWLERYIRRNELEDTRCFLLLSYSKRRREEKQQNGLLWVRSTQAWWTWKFFLLYHHGWFSPLFECGREVFILWSCRLRTNAMDKNMFAHTGSRKKTEQSSAGVRL